MKKLFGFMLIILLLATIFTSDLYAQMTIKSSDVKVANAAVLARPGHFYGIEVITNGTDAVAVVVYDNASAAAGTVLFQGTVSGTSNFGGVLYVNPVEAMRGIYVTITGDGGSYIVYYRVR